MRMAALTSRWTSRQAPGCILLPFFSWEGLNLVQGLALRGMHMQNRERHPFHRINVQATLVKPHTESDKSGTHHELASLCHCGCVGLHPLEPSRSLEFRTWAVVWSQGPLEAAPSEKPTPGELLQAER